MIREYFLPMRKILFAIIFFSTQTYAQQQQQQQQQQNNQQSGLNQRDQTCLQRTLVDSTYPPNPTGTPSITEPNISTIRGCLSLKKVSNRAGEDLSAGKEQKATTDQKITCVRKAGYTIDYQSCTSAASAYNQIVVLEAALLATQQIRTNNSNTAIANDVATRTASGDGQNAALDASISSNRNLSQMNSEQAMAYTAAVAYLGSKITSWTKTELASLQAKCPAETTAAVSPAYATLAEVPAPSCKDSLNYTYTNARSDMIANSAAKAAFISAAAMYAAKGIAAGIKASQLSSIANLTEAAKTETEDTTTTTTDTCTLESTSAECLALSSTTTTSTGTFGDTGGFEGTEFGVDATGTTATDDSAATSSILDGSASVADTTSPFADDIKNASSILDAAAAASLSPGTAGGSSGGGGAPATGGGSASLSPDNSAEAPAANSKPASTSVGYSVSGGSGFSATKKMEEGSNPFANLFENSKGGTSVDDGPDVSSADLDLFKKISSRYSKITEEKRIEARNLDD